MILQIHHHDLTSSLEFLPEHLLGDMLGDVSDENVRLEGLFLVPHDWLGRVWLEIVFLSGDVRSNEDGEVVFACLKLLIHTLFSCLGFSVIFEADESSPIVLCVQLSRNDISVFLENISKLSVVHVCWKVLDEEVGVFLTLIFSVSLLGVDR